MIDIHSLEKGNADKLEVKSVMLITSSRKRTFQRKTCLMGIMIAFALGLLIGAFIPLIGISSTAIDSSQLQQNQPSKYHHQNYRNHDTHGSGAAAPIASSIVRPSVTFVTTDGLKMNAAASSNNLLSPSYVELKSNDIGDASDQMMYDSKEKFMKKIDAASSASASSINDDFLKKHSDDAKKLKGVIDNDIYWGPTVETRLPAGYLKEHSDTWNRYINDQGVIVRLETGCGRMQNRMIVFADGRRACARYRQNTDQIQGELFSFYLAQLLNLTNLAPTTTSIIDANINLWASAGADIANAQWKSARPVVITKWIPDLEPAGIPISFQPLERHLNKYDVKNITQEYGRLVELAQWSDLIVFDYLIANLDRVVNNLYNYQWNADIMAAPAHNLARQGDTELLVFLDNESGLLHGYRLLKKYEAYHGLLLDNLCIFRKSTINALQTLRVEGVGEKLQEIFEKSTTATIRDVLPPLPEKSIKILNDRIDRVLGQVQKCRDQFSSR